ncbi:MAG TPA: imidazole glycerol phosphate synthase subunit HisH [Salinimicrobium sp.]|nr:imidazole glycerol phosphate synthase subunit HisH [Salinimicrobium sp.]
MMKKKDNTVVIIDYGAGNIRSIQFALERLGYHGRLSNSPEEIRSAEKVIFPGVGEAGSAMSKLRATGLDLIIPQLRQPVLGICLGMQLMCTGSEEGDTLGLDIFNVPVLRFSSKGVKVPQIGWNEIYDLKSEIFQNIPEKDYVYMVHSYYVPECPESIAKTDYRITYSSALQKENFYGLQFHPEKSGGTGERILKNFLKI